MKYLLLGFFLFTGTHIWAVVEKGQLAPNRCYQTVDEFQICLNDFSGATVVYLYNAGWCGPCNQEFQELVPRVEEFKSDPVVFISLSGSGWRTSQAPTSTFLREWKNKFSIPFAVAASPNDPGKDFFKPPFGIPAVVIINKSGEVTFKAQGAGVSQIFSEIRKTLR